MHADQRNKECIRVLFLFVNSIFIIYAVALMALGGYLLISEDNATFGATMVFIQVDVTGKVVFVTGLLSAVLAALGCYGAVKDYNFILYRYASILILLILVQMICATIIFMVEKIYIDLLHYFDAKNVANSLTKLVGGSVQNEDSLLDMLQKIEIRRTWFGIVCFVAATIEFSVVCCTYALTRYQ